MDITESELQRRKNIPNYLEIMTEHLQTNHHRMIGMFNKHTDLIIQLQKRVNELEQEKDYVVSSKISWTEFKRRVSKGHGTMQRGFQNTLRNAVVVEVIKKKVVKNERGQQIC